MTATWRFDDMCYAKEVSGSTPIPSGRPNINQNPNFKGVQYQHPKRPDNVHCHPLHGRRRARQRTMSIISTAGTGRLPLISLSGRNGDIWQYNPNIKSAIPGTAEAGGSRARAEHISGMCKNANSIGIELCTHKQNGEWIFYDATIEAARRLVQYLMQTYNIKQEERHSALRCERQELPGSVRIRGRQCSEVGQVQSQSLRIYHLRRQLRRFTVCGSHGKEADTQKGAFTSLDNAKKCAQNWNGYHVFDNVGNMIM